MRMRWLTMLSVAIVLTLVLATCGDDDSDDDNAGGANATEQTRAQSGDEVPVAMLDQMRFEPETLTVQAGDEVTILLTNDGAITHNMSIEDTDVDVDLDGGEEETITFTAPDSPGEFKIWCAIPGHEAAGMIGTLVVEA
jgi:plastocyanin